VKKNEKFEKLRAARLKEYRKWSSCFCPALKEYVYFTSDGFHHLRFEVTGRARSIKEQMYKMGLLPLAIPVIKNATQIEYRKSRSAIRRTGV